MIKLINIVEEIRKEELDEFNAKKALATGALALGLAGSPNVAKAQNFQGLKDKFKAGVTAVQNKLHPQQKVDTVKIQKDAPLELAKFKDDQNVGYGIAKSRNENTVRQIAYLNASADLMKKLGKTQMTAGIEIVDEKMYQLPDGTYEAETTVKAGNYVKEGIDDPVQPGILKKRLGKLSCTRVRAAKAKLDNKGTHYAKALQRYLNYHC
jgi:hypothetical protein